MERDMYHLNEEGKPHLKGHCDWESRWLRRDLIDDSLIGTCSGCGILIPEDVWSDDMDDPHELCVA